MESEPGKLFVGGVPQETTIETLEEHFNKYGEVLKTLVLKDTSTGQGRGFGFVKFKDPSVVDQVLQDQHVILEKMVEVKLAKPKSDQRPKNRCCQGCFQHQGVNRSTCNNNCMTQFKTKKIFVGGLPSNLTKEEFQMYFESYGTVKDAVLMRKKENNRLRGFGFITFDSEEVAENVLQKNFYELNNKLVEVKRARPKDWNSRHMRANELGFGGVSSARDWEIYHSYPYHSSSCVACVLPHTCSVYNYGVNPYLANGYTSVHNASANYDLFFDMARYYPNNPVSYSSQFSYQASAMSISDNIISENEDNDLVEVLTGSGLPCDNPLRLEDDETKNNEADIQYSPCIDDLQLKDNGIENKEGGTQVLATLVGSREDSVDDEVDAGELSVCSYMNSKVSKVDES